MPFDISQAVPLTMIGGFAYALGRLTQRVNAIDRTVTSELRRFSETLGHRLDGFDSRMRFIEKFLIHMYRRVFGA